MPVAGVGASPENKTELAAQAPVDFQIASY
jgi:hypothetical protein